MTTYNTGNPVPSADARDRYDNSQTLDEVVNGDSASYTTRTGKQVISLGGMNSRFNNAQEARESEFNLSQEEKQEAFQSFLDGTGWSSIGAYGAGVVITSHTQTVDYLGQPYALKPSIPASLTTPYVTTGVWATEGVKFKLVGDNSLRQDLADSADPAKGLGLTGRMRWNDLWSSVGVGKITGQSILDSMDVNLWEFAYLVTVKPNASNPSTWVWTPAIQEGIYKSNLLRKRLYCPPGDYLVTDTLLVPVTAVTNIYSDNNYFNADVIAATYRAPMRFVCDIPSGPLFKTTDGTKGRLNLQGICAANISTVNPDCRVLDFELYGSLVTENFFHSFHGIAKGGIGFVTQIKNNVGMNIRKTMFEGSFVDSFIDTNYLSMSVETVGVETAIFRGSVGLSNFTNNFCEFAVKGIVSSALTNAEIYGNTFDYMAAPIDIAGVSGSIVSLNKFTHCSKYYVDRLALAADDPLRTNNWISIKVGNTAKGLTMVGNVGSRIDILGSFRSGGYSDFITMGNVVEPVADRGANILWDVATADIDKIRLTENDDRVYAVAPSLTGVSENQRYGVGNLKFMKLGGSAKLLTCSASKVLATVTASEAIDMSALPLRTPLRLHVVVGSGFSTYSYKIYDIYRDSVVRVFQVSANEENSAAASSTVTVVGSSISINAVGSSASKTMAYNFLIL